MAAAIETGTRTTIDGGPSRMDLMLSLFDEDWTKVLKFSTPFLAEGQPREFKVWLHSLSRENIADKGDWSFTGKLTADSPMNRNARVSGQYNDHARFGYLEILESGDTPL